jgi:DNA-binding MarR family transcriptional regulator
MKTGDSRYCQCIYFSSNALARKLTRLAEASWKPVGLSPSHAYLLMIVIDQPGVQPSELCDELQLSPSTITRLIEKLEEKKLVVRTAGGKLTNVYPTPRGKALQPQLNQCLEHFYKTYSAALGADESAKLVQNMNRISDKLES